MEVVFISKVLCIWLDYADSLACNNEVFKGNLRDRKKKEVMWCKRMT